MELQIIGKIVEIPGGCVRVSVWCAHASVDGSGTAARETGGTPEKK